MAFKLAIRTTINQLKLLYDSSNADRLEKEGARIEKLL